MDKERKEDANNRKIWIDEEEGCCVCGTGKGIVHYELLLSN